MPLSNQVVMPSIARAKDSDDVVIDDTVGGVVLLSANKYRKSALIINTGSEPMRVTTDGSEPTPIHGKLVSANSSLVLSSPYCPTSEVLAIRQGATNTTANASEVD